MKNPLYLLLLFTVMLTAPFTSCAYEKPPATYVLVHGAWQAPYAWETVKQQLEKKGNKVIVIELPGHGDDQTPPAVLTLNSYRDKVIAAIDTVKGKVILVGHSMAGFVISITAEQVPDKIDKLVFLGAFAPLDGQSLFSLATVDKESLLGPGLVPSADKLTIDVKKENLIQIFCADGSDAVKKEVLDNYRTEPAIPLTNSISLTADHYGKANRYYIFTLQDHAISITAQKRMVAAAGITQTYSLDSSHCPFLSMPSQVTNLLLKIAAN